MKGFKVRFFKFITSMLLLAILLSACAGSQPTPEPSTITGSVFCDQNKDGECDCEESGLVDIEIQIFLDHCGGTPQQTLLTDPQGQFTFYDFPPGTYFVQADLDYVCGGRVPTTLTCQQVELAAGQTVTLPPFGYSEYGQ